MPQARAVAGRRLAALLAAGVALFAGGRAGAGALDNSWVGTRAIAMGSAFTGLADDPSAIYYNAAGLAFLAPGRTRAEAYGYLSFTSFTYENAGAVFESHEKPIVPGLFAARAEGRFAIGFGYYIPYGGGGTAYPDFMGTGVELKSAAGFQAFTLAAAYKLTERFSIGGGASMFVGLFDTRAPQAIAEPVPALVDYQSRYEGRSGYGWNLGVLYKATDVLSVGVSAISPSGVQMDGEERVQIGAIGVDATSDSRIDLRVPWFFSVGLGVKPRPGLTLGLSACFMHWSDLDEVVLTNAATGTSVRQATHYEDNYRLSLGVEYAASKSLTIRAGLKWAPGATEDGYLVPTANDVNLVVPSLGVGYRVGRSLELDLSTFYVSGLRATQGREAFDQDHVMLVVGARWAP